MTDAAVLALLIGAVVGVGVVVIAMVLWVMVWRRR